MRIPLSILALAVCAYAADTPVDQQAPAQTPPTSAAPADPAKPADATPPAPPPKYGGWVFSGLADAYVDYNGNSPTGNLNGLQNFDLHDGPPRLSLAKFTIDKSDKMFGLHLDLGAGETMRLIHATDPAAQDHKALRYVEQMYLIAKPDNSHGTEVDFGQFVTSAGAEVIESSSNWNYTRSLLFAYAIPYYHFGLKTSTPLTKEVSVGFQITNAWNTLWGNNPMSNIAFTLAVTKSKLTYNLNYLEGPNHIGTAKGKRNLFDTTVVLTPNPKFSWYLNFDWAKDNDPVGTGSGVWYGIASAARYQATKLFAVATRAEYFDDKKGYATGLKQGVKEITGTVEYKMNDHLVARFEARHDGSNTKFFDKGPGKPLANGQNTVTLGIVALLGPLK